LMRWLATLPDDVDIVFNNGYYNNKAAICASNDVGCLTTPYPMGNGAAIKRGARAAGGDILVFMDGDGQHDPADIARLLDKLDEGYDMVVGARAWEGQADVGRCVAHSLY